MIEGRKFVCRKPLIILKSLITSFLLDTYYWHYFCASHTNSLILFFSFALPFCLKPKIGF